jgi:hypothetical protein
MYGLLSRGLGIPQKLFFAAKGGQSKAECARLLDIEKAVGLDEPEESGKIRLR